MHILFLFIWDNFDKLISCGFVPNVGFILRRESRPGFVGAPVILVTRGHLDVIVELDNLKQE